MALTVGLSPTNLANAMLNGIRHTAFDVNGTTVKLHIGIPGVDGDSNYCQGDTSAKTCTFAAAGSPTAGAIALSNSPTWTNSYGNETLTHVSVWTSTTFLWSAVLNPSKVWNSTDTFTLNTLTFGLTPLAAD